MTNRDLVNTIRTHFDSPISDDNKLSPRWVLFVLKKMRALLLWQELKQNQVINDADKQTISIPFVETDEEFCDCETNGSVCKILRSRCPIPRILDNKIYDISSTSGKLQFEVIDFQHLKYKKESRIDFNKKKIFAFTRSLPDGQFLYLANTEFVDKAIIVALFEDPQEAKDFNCCENKLISCTPLDDPFYLNERLVPQLLDMSIKYFSTAMNRQDIFNNDLSDLDLSQGSKK